MDSPMPVVADSQKIYSFVAKVIKAVGTATLQLAQKTRGGHLAKKKAVQPI